MELFEYLDSLGINNPEIAFDKVHNEWKKKDRDRFAAYLFTLVQGEAPAKNSLFNFTANGTLSGFPIPCADVECRMQNINKLARFASLYADTVYISSPFDKYQKDKEIPPIELFFDIYCLLKLRPLIETGIVKYSSEYICLCQSCLDKITTEDNKFKEKMNLVYDLLEEEYIQNVKFKLNYETEKPFFEITGPEKYVFHERSYIHFRKFVPDPIKEIMVKGKSIEIPQQILQESGILNSLISPIMDDVYHQNSVVRLYDVSYLTDRDIDINVLNALHSENDFERSSKLVDSLTHLLPIIEDLNLNKIVELRIKDGESFNTYRDSLTKLINQKSNHTAKELKEMFRDQINPELNKIEQTIKRNKKNLIGSVARDITFASSIISVGLYSGLLPKDIGKIVAALGGTKFFYELYNKMGKTFSRDEEIEKNSYYFLWKLIG